MFSFLDIVLKEAKCLQFPLGFTPQRMRSFHLHRSSFFTRSGLASLSDNSRFLELCLSSQGRVRFNAVTCECYIFPHYFWPEVLFLFSCRQLSSRLVCHVEAVLGPWKGFWKKWKVCGIPSNWTAKLAEAFFFFFFNPFLIYQPSLIDSVSFSNILYRFFVCWCM